LLDFDKAPKVILEKGKKEKIRKVIRINMPQKNLKKFKEVLLYILNKVGAKPNVGVAVIKQNFYILLILISMKIRRAAHWGNIY